MSDKKKVTKKKVKTTKITTTLESDEQKQQVEANSYFMDLIENEECDPKCIHEVNQRLVRIVYPGIVKNLDKALATLGGIKGVEQAVATDKLELNFHPKNKYNKGVIADTHSNSGLLVKVIRKQKGEEAPTFSYEIVGATVKNFVFNKFMDFQYLPLVAEFPETKDSTVECIYNSILPKKIPDLGSVLQDDSSSIPLFLPPTGFSRSDIQMKINPITKLHTNENDPPSSDSQKKKEKKISAFAKPKQISIFHKFDELEIPEKPTEYISQLVKRKNYQDHLSKLEKLFRERPIWTKNGLKFHSNFSNDILRVLLPAVAYYELTGPWRCTWISFGYDPRNDPVSKIYQNLDYRIPYSVRTNLKIGSKRVPESKDFPTSLDKLENKRTRSAYNENSFMLRPNCLPMARQVFYQYCDILLPEIQVMLSRLPPALPNAQCDPKNGWFPSSFVEQCREIVTKYIDKQAAIVLRKQRESLPPNPLEEFVNSSNRFITDSMTDAVAGPSTSSDENFDVFTIYDSDSDEDDSTGYEKFYQENNLYDLVERLDDPTADCDNLLSELHSMVKGKKK